MYDAQTHLKNSLLSTHACSSAYQREGVMEDHSLGVSKWVCMFNSFDHFLNVKKKVSSSQSLSQSFFSGIC